jgi:predicted GIY-YIG superfamily endonuclease
MTHRTEHSHFVYVLLNDGKPFYVGQSSNERRLFEHIAKARRRDAKRSTTKAKDKKICQMLAEGRKPELRKIATGLSYSEAHALERQTIADMGQIHIGTGPLVNGDNVKTLAEPLRPMSPSPTPARSPRRSPTISASNKNRPGDNCRSREALAPWPPGCGPSRFSFRHSGERIFSGLLVFVLGNLEFIPARLPKLVSRYGFAIGRIL